MWLLYNNAYYRLRSNYLIKYSSCVQVIEKVDAGYRLPPPPGCPRMIYELMIQCWYDSQVAQVGIETVMTDMHNEDWIG